MTTENSDDAPAEKTPASVTDITPGDKPDAEEAAALTAKLDAGFFADVVTLLTANAQLKEPTREAALTTLKQYMAAAGQLVGENQKMRQDEVRLRALVREATSFI